MRARVEIEAPKSAFGLLAGALPVAVAELAGPVVPEVAVGVAGACAPGRRVHRIRLALIIEKVCRESAQLALDGSKLVVYLSRLRPEAAELATGNTAQASIAPSGDAQATEVSLLFCCGGLPGGVAGQVRGHTGQVVEGDDQPPKALTLGSVSAPSAEAAARAHAGLSKSRRNGHRPDGARGRCPRRKGANPRRGLRGKGAGGGADGAAHG